jgi:hypothetical protein
VFNLNLINRVDLMLLITSCQNKNYVVSVLLTTILLIVSSNVMAAQVKVQWDLNSESNVVGYRVYCRLAHEDYDYEKPSWSGPYNNCVIRNLEENTNYYFVARAFTYSGEESEDSTEVEYDYEHSSGGLDTDINMDLGYEGNNNSAGIRANSAADGGKGCFLGSVLNFN